MIFPCINPKDVARDALRCEGLPYDQEGIDKCFTWCLGKEYGIELVTNTPELWNARHSDIFILLGTDNIDAGTRKMVAAYKKHGYEGKVSEPQ